MFSTEQNSDERMVGNLGFGKRKLSEDKLTLIGTNLFFDYDFKKLFKTYSAIWIALVAAPFLKLSLTIHIFKVLS